MDDLQILADRDLWLLRLDSDDWEELEQTRYGGTRFSLTFGRALARDVRKGSLVLIVISEEDGESSHLRMGFVRSKRPVTTFDAGIGFDLVSKISPDSVDDLFGQITENSLQASVKRFNASEGEFQKLSPKLGNKLLKLIWERPWNQSALQRILWQLRIPRRITDARALQPDAVKMALEFFGAKEEELEVSELSITGDSALARLRLQEDAVIEHDARWIEGWNMATSEPTGRAVFELNTRYGTERLEVFTANKRPLEELFGVDLIYLNRSRGALVMVQYKMMEPGERPKLTTRSYERAEQEWIVRLDDQFMSELDRMRVYEVDDANGAYRLNPSAFFFKLVKRDAEIRSTGLILSLGHLEHLLSDGSLVGTKGGLRISYRELDGHYMTGSGFIELVRSGYVGTRGATTVHLEQLINVTLSQGRAVVAAIKSTLNETRTDDEKQL